MFETGAVASFKLECLKAIHDLGNDTIKAALYASSASLDHTTTAYTATGEVTDTNWPAGGQQLLPAAGYPKLDPTGRFATWGFQNLTVTGPCTMTFRGVLLYNASKSNRAIFVIDKGIDIIITAGAVTLFSNPGAPWLITLQ